MYKSKEKQKEATRERVRRYRDRAKGVTESMGVTSPPTSKGVTKKEGVTKGVPPLAANILDKLTDPKWRANIEYICSHLRECDKEVTYLGGVPLPTVCDWLECTEGVIAPERE